jgi:hypothetical protein
MPIGMILQPEMTYQRIACRHRQLGLTFRRQWCHVPVPPHPSVEPRRRIDILQCASHKIM